MSKHIYAIGWKGWVELRQADKPPKAITTRASKMIKERKIDYNAWDYYGSPKWKTVDSEVKIINVFFEGGKTLNTLSADSFCRVAKTSPPRYRQMITLTPAAAKRLKEKGYLNGKAQPTSE